MHSLNSVLDFKLELLPGVIITLDFCACSNLFPEFHTLISVWYIYLDAYRGLSMSQSNLPLCKPACPQSTPSLLRATSSLQLHRPEALQSLWPTFSCKILGSTYHIILLFFLSKHFQNPATSQHTTILNIPLSQYTLYDHSLSFGYCSSLLNNTLFSLLFSLCKWLLYAILITRAIIIFLKTKGMSGHSIL